MVTYAAWLPITENWLRGPEDDVYRRPLFSIVDDNKEDDDPEHLKCHVCQGNISGNRWVPNNGGAWVNAHMWEDCGRDFATYMERTKHWGELPCH